MEFNFKLLALLAIFLVANEATQVLSSASNMASPETYWKSVLPNTPIPEAIKHILDLGQSEPRKVKLAETNDEEDTTLNFIAQDLRPGNTMDLHLRKTTNEATFAMPSSLNKFAEEFYKITEPDPDRPHAKITEPDPDRPHAKITEPDPDRPHANIIRKTVQRCEELKIRGRTELQNCLTSLESMINFVTTRLGHDVRAINAEVKHGETELTQKYTIESGVKKLGGSRFVACHKLNYPYAMFYCHTFEANEGYAVRVPLKGSNGAEVAALGVCHTINKQEWDKYLVRVPDSMAAVKSGKVPLCHFLAGDSIIWTNKRSD